MWKNTPPATTFDQLHRRPEAKSIAKKLELNLIKHSGRCVACHSTQQTSVSGNIHTIARVMVILSWCRKRLAGYSRGLRQRGDHSPYRIPAHRQQRIGHSVAAGMRNPTNVYSIPQSCRRCHTTADEELVNVGGHSADSLDFEFVFWS